MAPLFRRLRAGALVAGIAAAALTSAAARADGEPSAQELYTAAKADLDAGHHETACPALFRSYRMAPRPLTLYYLAYCTDKAGRVASASAYYQQYVQAFDHLSADEQKEQRSLETAAAERRRALEPTLPRFTFLLPPSAPFGTRVLRKSAEGAAVEIPVGVPLPIDPGEHVLTTETPAGKIKELRFGVQPGEKRTVVAAVEAGPTDPPPARYAAETPPVPLTLAPEEKPASSLRKAAYVLGGAGIAGIAIGIVGGALVLSQKSTVAENCVDRYCNRPGQSAADLARAGGTVANLAFPVGLALLAAGAGLYLAEPAPPKLGSGPPRVAVKLAIDPTGTALRVEGAF